MRSPILAAFRPVQASTEMPRYIIPIVVDVDDESEEAQGDEWEMTQDYWKEAVDDYTLQCVTLTALDPIELPEVK